MSNVFYEKDIIREVDSIDLLKIASDMGLELKKADKKSYKCLHQGGLYIYPNENRFYSFSNGNSGKAISFVMYQASLSFNEAVAFLLDRYSILNHYPISSISPEVFSKKEIPKEPDKKGELLLPNRDENDKKVIWYLNQVRKIDKQLIFRCLKNGSIYQDKKKNVVFLGKDKEGKIRYAALRGTSEMKFQGEVEHSDKRFGFELNAEDKTKVIVVESPIDALSLLSMNKKMPYPIISLGSGSDLHLEEYLKNHLQVQEIILALDDDFLSKRNWGQENAQKLIEKYKDRYLVKNTHSILKDWNEDLVAFSKGLSKEEIQELKKTQLLTYDMLSTREVQETMEYER